MLLNAEIVATTGRTIMEIKHQKCIIVIVRNENNCSTKVLCVYVCVCVCVCVCVQERVRQRQTCADRESNLVLIDISAVYVPTSNYI